MRAAAGGRGALGAAASSFARGSSTGAAGGGVTDDGADRRLRSPCVGDNEAVDSCHSHQYAADRAGGGFAATSAPAASAAGGGFGAGFGDASAASVLEGGARTLSAAVHGAACMGVGMPGVMSAGGFPDAGAGFNAMGVAEHNHQQQPVKVKPVWKVTTVLAAAPPDPPASAGPFPPSGEGQALDLASDSGVPMVASAAASADGAAGYGGPMEAAAAVFPFEMHTPSLPPHPASAPPAGAAQPQHVGFTACLPGYAPAPALTATGVGDTSAAAAGATKCCWTVVNLTAGTTTHQPVVVGGVVGGGEHAGAASGGAACVDASPALPLGARASTAELVPIDLQAVPATQTPCSVALQAADQPFGHPGAGATTAPASAPLHHAPCSGACSSTDFSTSPAAPLSSVAGPAPIPAPLAAAGAATHPPLAGESAPGLASAAAGRHVEEGSQARVEGGEQEGQVSGQLSEQQRRQQVLASLALEHTPAQLLQQQVEEKEQQQQLQLQELAVPTAIHSKEPEYTQSGAGEVQQHAGVAFTREQLDITPAGDGGGAAAAAAAASPPCAPHGAQLGAASLSPSPVVLPRPSPQMRAVVSSPDANAGGCSSALLQGMQELLQKQQHDESQRLEQQLAQAECQAEQCRGAAAHGMLAAELSCSQASAPHPSLPVKGSTGTSLARHSHSHSHTYTHSHSHSHTVASEPAPPVAHSYTFATPSMTNQLTACQPSSLPHSPASTHVTASPPPSLLPPPSSSSCRPLFQWKVQQLQVPVVTSEVVGAVASLDQNATADGQAGAAPAVMPVTAAAVEAAVAAAVGEVEGAAAAAAAAATAAAAAAEGLRHVDSALPSGAHDADGHAAAAAAAAVGRGGSKGGESGAGYSSSFVQISADEPNPVPVDEEGPAVTALSTQPPHDGGWGGSGSAVAPGGSSTTASQAANLTWATAAEVAAAMANCGAE